MKKSRIIASAAITTLAFTAFALMVHGDELVYDSTKDPLVSLSYVNEVVVTEFNKKLSDLSAKLDKLTTENDALKKQVSDLNTKLTSSGSADTSGYTVVYLTKGAKLMADSACEIILRSGSAIAVSITENGINDITDGTEIMNAADIPLYHCLLVPRGGDGRGIQVTSAEAYIMVRGAYQIVK